LYKLGKEVFIEDVRVLIFLLLLGSKSEVGVELDEGISGAEGAQEDH